MIFIHLIKGILYYYNGEIQYQGGFKNSEYDGEGEESIK